MRIVIQRNDRKDVDHIAFPILCPLFLLSAISIIDPMSEKKNPPRKEKN